MQQDIREFEGLRVKIDDVIYMPNLDASPEKPHPFVYFISIYNHSAERITIRGRKWVVKEDNGEISVVEGDGVVGQQPEIACGEHFSYNSYHVIATSAEVSGAFFGQTASGEWGYTRIPSFRLDVPE